MQCIIRSTCLNNTGNCRRGKIPHLKALLKLHYPNEENHLLCEKCLGQQAYPMNSKWIIIHIPRIVTILSYTQNHKENKTPKTLSLASASCSLLRQVQWEFGNIQPWKWSRIWVKQKKHRKIPTKIQPQQDAVGLFFGFVLGSYADIRHPYICKTGRKWFFTQWNDMLSLLYNDETLNAHPGVEWSK